MDGWYCSLNVRFLPHNSCGPLKIKCVVPLSPNSPFHWLAIFSKAWMHKWTKGLMEAAGKNGHNTSKRKQATFPEKRQRSRHCVSSEKISSGCQWMLSSLWVQVVWCVSASHVSVGNTGSFLVWMSAAALLYKSNLAQWLMWACAVSGTSAVISFVTAKRGQSISCENLTNG